MAGVARHTLLTSSARDGLDQRTVPADFGPLLDFWQGFGAWTQWWIAVRALSEILSRLDRHADAAVLLGALAAASAAPPPFGPDLIRARAVEAAARTALGEQFAGAAGPRRGTGPGAGGGVRTPPDPAHRRPGHHTFDVPTSRQLDEDLD